METCLGHVYIVLEPIGSARLKLDDVRYYEFCVLMYQKVVRSPEYDHGHDEESLNGRDIKIDISEAYVWTSEVFQVKSAFYRSTERLPEPPLPGEVMGHMGLSGEREGQPGWAARLLPPWSELD